MSEQWGRLPLELIVDPGISPGAKCLYGFLAWSASGKEREGRTLPWSHKGLARKLHVDERTIRRWLAELDDGGWITIEYPRQGQRNAACTYLVHSLTRTSVTRSGMSLQQEDVEPKQKTTDTGTGTERREEADQDKNVRVRSGKRNRSGTSTPTRTTTESPPRNSKGSGPKRVALPSPSPKVKAVDWKNDTEIPIAAFRKGTTA
jgi:hypothetical protein